MARAADRDRFVDLGDGTPFPLTCKQQVVTEGRCHDGVDYTCDACGKPVCRAHIAFARLDPSQDSGYRSPFRADVPEICDTCLRLEQWWSKDRIEDIPDKVRSDFYRSDEAMGHVGEYERQLLADRRTGAE